MVLKRAILKEENERCRVEAECRVEIKKLNQRIQAVQESAGSSKLTQVGYYFSSKYSYIRNFYLS